MTPEERAQAFIDQWLSDRQWRDQFAARTVLAVLIREAMAEEREACLQAALGAIQEQPRHEPLDPRMVEYLIATAVRNREEETDEQE